MKNPRHLSHQTPFDVFFDILIATAESDRKFHDGMNKNPLVKQKPSSKAHKFAIGFVRDQCTLNEIIQFNQYPLEVYAYLLIIEFWKNRK